MSNKRYREEVSTIVQNGFTNFIANGNPDELEFRLWLGARKHYYQFRLENIIVARKPTTGVEILTMLQEEVDKIKETTFLTLSPLQPEAEIINLANREN